MGLREERSPNCFIQVIKTMNHRAETHVRTCGGDTDASPITSVNQHFYVATEYCEHSHGNWDESTWESTKHG